MKRESAKVAVTGFLLALVLLGCATGPAYDPFLKGKADFFAKTKTIALAPMIYPEGLEREQTLSVGFEDMIESELSRAGWSVISPGETKEIWSRMREMVGGYQDPDSGEVDEAKHKAVREHTFRELKRLWNVDAVLYPSIRVFNVSWRGREVYWHGTNETIQSFGDAVMDKLPYAFLGVSVTRSGTVRALSLGITMEDINGVAVYNHNGGIQLLAKVARGNYVPVPKHALLSVAERNTAAAKFALGPLLEKSTSPSEKQVASQ